MAEHHRAHPIYVYAVRARNGQNDYINYHRIKSINAVSGMILSIYIYIYAFNAAAHNVDYDEMQ